MRAAVRGSESPEVQWTYETCTTDDRVARCPIGVRLLERQSATEGDAQMWQVSSKVSSSTLRGTADPPRHKAASLSLVWTSSRRSRCSPAVE